MNSHAEFRRLAATIYPIKGIHKKIFTFRVLRVREPVPNDNLKPIRLQKWADRLWRKELRCPVYPSSRMGFPAFLIPNENSPNTGTTIQIPDVPDTIYHIDVTDQTLSLSIEDATSEEQELICRMLERPFTERLASLRSEFWKAEWTLFFRISAENANVQRDVINAFRGIKFGVILLNGSAPFLVTDIRTKYVGRKPLSNYSEQEKQDILKDHLDLDKPTEDRATFLRDNGPVKIPCRYTGETGQTVSAHHIMSLDDTVYGYYQKQYPALKILPSDQAVFVKDRVNSDASIPVPGSRLFPVFTTEFEGVRKCSVRSQMTPEERVYNIESFLAYFKNLNFAGHPLSVGRKYWTQDRTVFLPPRLEFGKSRIVDPFTTENPPDPESSAFDSLIARWGSRKLPGLYSFGPFHNEPLPDLILLYPNTIDRNIRESLLKLLDQEIQKQTGQKIRILQQKSYAIGRSERYGSSLLREASQTTRERPRCLMIVVLWDGFAKSVHGELKDAVKPAYSQCVTERTVRSICQQTNPQNSANQLRNLSLAILTEAGIKPWVIADDLNHDIHIGIDTLYSQVGYHVLYGKGGRLIHQMFGESITRGRWKVSIKTPELARRLNDAIHLVLKTGQPVDSMIIHRDGRWWQSESDALHLSVRQWISQGIVPSNFRCAAVEVRKSHSPVRLFTEVNDAKGVLLQNPLPGTFMIIDSNKILLTTTGKPVVWEKRGVSAGSLLLEVVDSIGEINIKDVGEDAYRLTHLNWNAPDIEIALPVTIRWTDEALRETLRHPSEDETDDETIDEDDLISSYD